MKKFLPSILFGLACSALISPSASQNQQTRSADLGLAVAAVPVRPLLPGDIVHLTLTITNQGPEAAPYVAAVTSSIPTGRGRLFFFGAVPPSTCEVVEDHFAPGPGGTGSVVAGVIAGSMKPGETRTCTLDIVVADRAARTYDFTLRLTDGQVLINDPNPADNQASLQLVFATTPGPVRVPTLSASGAVFLGLGFLLLGVYSQRRTALQREHCPPG